MKDWRIGRPQTGEGLTRERVCESCRTWFEKPGAEPWSRWLRRRFCGKCSTVSPDSETEPSP